MTWVSRLTNSPAGREFLKATGSITLTWATIAAGATGLLMVSRQPPAPREVRVVESPPPQFTSGPTLSGRTYQIDLTDAAQVNYLCTLALGPTSPPGGYWMGCYNGKMDAVIVPTKAAWPSEIERQALIRHEWAHARGWVHQNDGRFGRPRDSAPATQTEPTRPILIPTAPPVAAR